MTGVGAVTGLTGLGAVMVEGLTGAAVTGVTGAAVKGLTGAAVKGLTGAAVKGLTGLFRVDELSSGGAGVVLRGRPRLLLASTGGVLSLTAVVTAATVGAILPRRRRSQVYIGRLLVTRLTDRETGRSLLVLVGGGVRS